MDLTGDCGLPYAVSICFLVILLFFMAEASDTPNQKRCTQSVKEERVRFVYKKISVMRKIPAQCSGWDRDWSWITNKDCKDKYRVEYLNDKRQVKVTTYRTEHVCCPNEVGSWCNVSLAESRRPGEPGYTTETQTLLTVLLPVVATVAFIFIISIVIIGCIIVRKRRRRAGNGAASGKHSYESVKGVDSKKKGAGKLQKSSDLGEIPFSVEVVDAGPDRVSVTSELLGQGQADILDLSKPPVPAVDTTDRFRDIDKDTVIDNTLLYNILVDGENRTEPTAPTLDQVVT